MKIKMCKILIISLTVMLILSNISVFGATVKDAFSANNTSDVSGAITATHEILGMVLDIIRIVGIGIAIIILTYIGIKFMLASPSERANIKQYSINYVIGAFILIGATGILTIIKDFAGKIE